MAPIWTGRFWSALFLTVLFERRWFERRCFEHRRLETKHKYRRSVSQTDWGVPDRRTHCRVSTTLRFSPRDRAMRFGLVPTAKRLSLSTFSRLSRGPCRRGRPSWIVQIDWLKFIIVNYNFRLIIKWTNGMTNFNISASVFNALYISKTNVERKNWIVLFRSSLEKFLVNQLKS